MVRLKTIKFSSPAGSGASLQDRRSKMARPSIPPIPPQGWENAPNRESAPPARATSGNAAAEAAKQALEQTSARSIDVFSKREIGERHRIPAGRVPGAVQAFLRSRPPPCNSEPPPSRHMKRKRGLVAHTSSVDVGELNRAGAFSGGPFWFPFRQLTTNKFSMEYSGSEWPEGRPAQMIPVRWTRCHFGGMRPWLVCPCGKRVAKLLSYNT